MKSGDAAASSCDSTFSTLFLLPGTSRKSIAGIGSICFPPGRTEGSPLIRERDKCPLRLEQRVEAKAKAKLKATWYFEFVYRSSPPHPLSFSPLVVLLIKIHFVAPAAATQREKNVAVVQLPSRGNCENGIRDIRSRFALGRTENGALGTRKNRVKRKGNCNIFERLEDRLRTKFRAPSNDVRIPGEVKYPVRSLPQTFYCKCLAFSK